MTFEDWWENLKEYELDPYRGCDKYEAYDMLVECWSVATKETQPKPSTNMSIPRHNHGKEYLLWCENRKSWFIGFWGYYSMSFMTHEGSPCEHADYNITHWLPLPNNP